MRKKNIIQQIPKDSEIGVESSARDALNRDFYSGIVSDAVSSPDKDAHARSLQNMERFLTVASINEIVNIWSLGRS